MRLVTYDAATRISAADALQHRYFTEGLPPGDNALLAPGGTERAGPYPRRMVVPIAAVPTQAQQVQAQAQARKRKLEDEPATGPVGRGALPPPPLRPGGQLPGGRRLTQLAPPRNNSSQWD